MLATSLAVSSGLRSGMRDTPVPSPMLRVVADRGACEKAPNVCIGVPYFNWAPAFSRIVGAAKAGKVYDGMTPLTSEDLAEAMFWAATLPRHVNINGIQLMPVEQSFSPFAVHRRSAP